MARRYRHQARPGGRYLQAFWHLVNWEFAESQLR